MCRLNIWSDLACSSAFGNPLKMAVPENLNVLFPKLSFALGIWTSSSVAFLCCKSDKLSFL